MKKIISLVLALVLMIGTLPVYVTASATGTAETVESCTEWEIIKNEMLQMDAENDESVDAKDLEIESDSMTEYFAAGDIYYQESEPNDFPYSANYISHNYTISGTLSSTDLLDHFKFVLDCRSEVLIIIAAKYSSLMCGVWDVADNLLASDTRGEFGTSNYMYTISCTLDAGTYYLGLLDDDKLFNSYTFYIEIDGIESQCTHRWYTTQYIAPTCTEDGYTKYFCDSCDAYWEDDYEDALGHTYIAGICDVCGVADPNYSVEAGTSFTTAIKIKTGEKYYKSWNAYNDHLCHYAKFALNKRCIVKVVSSKVTNSAGEVFELDMGILDEDGYLVLGNGSSDSAYDGKNVYSFYSGLEAGTYYLEISPGFYVETGTADIEYYIEVTPTEYCEVEPNDSMETANRLSLGSYYTGYYGHEYYFDTSETDFYSVELVQGYTYRLSISNFSELAKTTTIVSLVNDGQLTNIDYDMIDKIDNDGSHYYDFVARKSGTCYIYLKNYSGKQFEYGIKVSELKADKPSVPPAEINFTRLSGSSRYETSFAIANEMKEVLGKDKFDTIILASSDNFADALAGSYLAAQKQAPIIICKQKYAGIVCNYVNNNLASGGKVYVLGGEGAVPGSVLSGITVTGNFVRLAGAERYDTNLAILKEAGIGSNDLLVATGRDFADSLSASATGLPILLVNGKAGKSLSADQKAFLRTVKGNIYIIGGDSAVPAALMDEIETASGKTATRIAGGSRYETSVKIAEQFFTSADRAVVAYASTFPDGLCGGPLAYVLDAPLLLTKNGKSEAPGYTAKNSIVSGYVLGGTGLISDAFAAEIFAN